MEGPFRHRPDGLKVIETLRLAPGGAVHGARHLARMGRTCAALGLSFDPVAAQKALDAARGRADQRARLTVGPDGMELSCAPLAPTPASWSVALADEVVAAGDPWRRVKTTNRRVYDAARAAMPAGIDELIFLNDTRMVAEGGITNVFLARAGKLLTPPVSAGALPGILREVLLEEGRAEVAELAPVDLQTGALYCGNALRGLIAVRLVS